MTIRTYTPSDVLLLVNGVQIAGWETIKVSQTQPVAKIVRGIRGSVTRINNPDTSAVLTVDINQTSLSNDFLMNYVSKDRKSSNGLTPLQINLQQLSSQEYFYSDQGFIVQVPEISYSGDMGTRSWEIQCLQSEIVSAGVNSSRNQIIQQGISNISQNINNALGNFDFNNLF